MARAGGGAATSATYDAHDCLEVTALARAGAGAAVDVFIGAEHVVVLTAEGKLFSVAHCGAAAEQPAALQVELLHGGRDGHALAASCGNAHTVTVVAPRASAPLSYEASVLGRVGRAAVALDDRQKFAGLASGIVDLVGDLRLVT